MLRISFPITITLIDDDPEPVVTVTNTTFNFAENEQYNFLYLSFSPILIAPASLKLTTTNGSAIAGVDFKAQNTKYDIPNYSWYPIPIELIDNQTIGSNKEFTVTISELEGLRFSDGASSKTFTFTIVDDESTTLSITNTEFSINEDDGNFVMGFLLSDKTDVDVSITIGVTNGTAIGGSDFGTFDEISSMFKIPKRRIRGSFSIPILDDQINEVVETFTFTVNTVIGAKIASSEATKTITIIDDDTPLVEISASNYNVAEDAGNFKFDVVTSGSHTGFSLAIAFGDVDDTAVSGQDYTPLASNSYVFSPKSMDERSREREFTVSLIDNSIVEMNKTVTISFTINSQDLRKVQFPKGASTYTKTFTIVEDDSTKLSVKNTNFNVNENVGLGGFILRLGLSQASEADVSVEYEVDHIDPNTMSDFSVPALRKVIIPAGETLGTFTIRINDDSEKEGNETFRIILKDPIGAGHVSGDDTHNVDITIVDDEYPTVHLPRTLFFSEGAGEIEIAVVLEGVSTRLIAVSYETVDSESVDNFAIAGEDYTHQQGVLNFPPGTIEQKITIPIIDDNVAEVSEQFNINYAITIGDTEIHDSSGSTTGSRRVWIRDNESPTLSIANTKFYVSEDVGSNGYQLELPVTRIIENSKFHMTLQ